MVPTFNEAKNVLPLVEAVRAAMGSIPWEMIVVDDDSPDGTHAAVERAAVDEPRVRCLRRVGRKGLASAVVEGALAANGRYVGVMDADFQHDETVLPRMVSALESGADVAIGTRYAQGGSTGEWGYTRKRMSSFATALAQRLIKAETSDPMSGFFMARKEVFSASVYELSAQGYKILLDLLSSYPGKLKIAEVAYTFRSRREGDSKISPMILAEFAFMLIEKVTNGLIPPRFVLFAMVGGFGLLVHLAVLNALRLAGLSFIPSQAIATGAAILFNYVVNNEFTYRDRRLKGGKFLLGLLRFAVICSIGAIANVGVANLAIQGTNSWSIAGIAGALMGAVFNFGGASALVWNRRPKRRVR